MIIRDVNYHPLLPRLVAAIAVCAALASLWLLLSGQVIYLFLRISRPTLVLPQGDAIYTLHIDSQKIIVPIIPNIPADDEPYYLRATEEGVAHYKGTPLPGKKGNSVIFGHSSFFLIGPGKYKTVFQKLKRLKVGDQFQIQRDEELLQYEITRSEAILPTDFSVLEQTSEEQVTLMTCWPPGTVAKRYIVQAKRI